jgi:hypothetical protein
MDALDDTDDGTARESVFVNTAGEEGVCSVE